jgi:hypothetical protein
MEYPFPMDGMYQRFSSSMVHVLHVLHVVVEVLHVLHMVVEGLLSLLLIIASFHVGGESGDFFFPTIFVIFQQKIWEFVG